MRGRRTALGFEKARASFSVQQNRSHHLQAKQATERGPTLEEPLGGRHMLPGTQKLGAESTCAVLVMHLLAASSGSEHRACCSAGCRPQRVGPRSPLSPSPALHSLHFLELSTLPALLSPRS